MRNLLAIKAIAGFAGMGASLQVQLKTLISGGLKPDTKDRHLLVQYLVVCRRL